MKQRSLCTPTLAVWLLWLLSLSKVSLELLPVPEDAVGQCLDKQNTQQPTVETATASGEDETAKATRRFPSSNRVTAVNGKRLQELLDGLGSESNRSRSLVILFYLQESPHSRAMRPVYECLPAFFPPEVPFVSVSHTDLSLMALMTQGIHALPVLQVNARGRKYRYSGKHWLAPMLQFVSKALEMEPLASVDAALLCSSNASTSCSANSSSSSSGSGSSDKSMQACPASSNRSSSSSDNQTAVPSSAGVDDLSYKRVVAEGQPASTAANDADDQVVDLDDVSRGCNDHDHRQQQQQQQHSACGGWSCPRWDGEATVEELTAKQHGVFFYASAVFLVCRVIWWLWGMKRGKRQTAVEDAAAAVGAPGTAAAVDGPEAAAAAAAAAAGAAAAEEAAAVTEPVQEVAESVQQRTEQS